MASKKVASVTGSRERMPDDGIAEGVCSSVSWSDSGIALFSSSISCSEITLPSADPRSCTMRDIADEVVFHPARNIPNTCSDVPRVRVSYIFMYD